MSPLVNRDYRITMNGSVVDTWHYDKAKEHYSSFQVQQVLCIHVIPDCLLNNASILVSDRGIDPGIDCQGLREVQLRAVCHFDEIIDAVKAERLRNLAGREPCAVL